MKIQLPDFTQACISVFGDVMLDRYWHGTTNRISPEAPVPIVHVRELVECPGGAGNVALNIAALGAKVKLFGICGTDEAGQKLKDKLSEKQVEHYLYCVDGLPTITKLRVLSVHQQLVRLDFEESFANIDNSALVEAFIEHLSDTNVVILSDYGKGGLRDPQILIRAARKAGVPVLIDPKRKDFEVYRGASLITPNFKEFQMVVGPCKDDQDIYTKGLALLAKYELEAILVTRGERGMMLIRPDQPYLSIPTVAREVYDVTGAGDTVVATLAAAIAAGCDYPVATRLANTAAGHVVSKLGAATVTVSELRQALHYTDTSVESLEQSGIVTQESLLSLVTKAKERDETLVFVSGLFDVLHEGHIDYLHQAKAFGDRLIVALPEDNVNFCIHTLKQRMTVVASLSMVDWVVSYNELTPEILIGRILPHVLVRGLNESGEIIAGIHSVLYNDGSVQYLPFVNEFHAIERVTRRELAEMLE